MRKCSFFAVFRRNCICINAYHIFFFIKVWKITVFARPQVFGTKRGALQSIRKQIFQNSKFTFPSRPNNIIKILLGLFGKVNFESWNICFPDWLKRAVLVPNTCGWAKTAIFHTLIKRYHVFWNYYLLINQIIKTSMFSKWKIHILWQILS